MDDKIQQKLHELFLAYSKNLPAKIQGIETLWQEQMQHVDLIQFQTLHRDVHSLCGSAGTYGYPELGKAARQLEILLKNLLGNETIPHDMQKKITSYIEQLKAVLASEAPKTVAVFGAETATVSENKRVYIMEQDNVLCTALIESLNHAGFSAHAIQDAIILQFAVKESPPIAIIIDTLYLEQTEIQRVLDSQKQQQNPIQLLCIVPNTDLLPRIKAVRSGCDMFFQKPVDISYLTQLLNHKYNEIAGEPYRILIIDDAQPLGDYYSLVLTQAGMVARAITNPLDLLKELEAFQPDLILMDIYMPECTGLELAAVLRQEINYTKIPIIFLSTEEDKNKKLFAISLGGDDFLTKPISPQHLISAVQARSKRASILNYYMTTDSLTGLLNHSSILKQLDIELIRAKQKKIPLSFVMVDIDHFKTINDTYGHPMGDIVLKKLAELFLTRLRNQDAIGRYGGEEFVLILPGAPMIDSKKIANDLRIKFSQFCFEEVGIRFFVTFSAGVSSFSGENTAASMVLDADRALYHAKKMGRNQVC